MFSNPFTRRRRHTPRKSTIVADRRSGAPVRRRPAPMPRMRWYS
ncbi:MAG: hypothetical protein ACRDPC_02685 [Solirubrobacteraceae bacterium]